MCYNVEKDVRLCRVEDVKEFVKFLENKCNFDVDFSSGKYIVDAKSFMGIFSLDLSKIIKMTVHASEEESKELIDWMNSRNLIV